MPAARAQYMNQSKMAVPASQAAAPMVRLGGRRRKYPAPKPSPSTAARSEPNSTPSFAAFISLASVKASMVNQLASDHRL